MVSVFEPGFRDAGTGAVLAEDLEYHSFRERLSEVAPIKLLRENVTVCHDLQCALKASVTIISAFFLPPMKYNPEAFYRLCLDTDRVLKEVEGYHGLAWTREKDEAYVVLGGWDSVKV